MLEMMSVEFAETFLVKELQAMVENGYAVVNSPRLWLEVFVAMDRHGSTDQQG